MDSEYTLIGKVEEKTEKSGQNGRFFSLKISGKYMSAFGDAANAISQVPVGAWLNVTYTTTNKNGKVYNNLQAFSSAPPQTSNTQNSSDGTGSKDDNIAKSVAANCTVELAKSCPDVVEKLGPVGFFHSVAPEIYKWLKSDGKNTPVPVPPKDLPSDELKATEEHVYEFKPAAQ